MCYYDRPCRRQRYTIIIDLKVFPCQETPLKTFQNANKGNKRLR